jgi:hypothetical protein
MDIEAAGIGRDVLSVIVFLTAIIAIAAIGIAIAYIVMGAMISAVAS